MVSSNLWRCSFSKKPSHVFFLLHLTVLRHFYKVCRNNRCLILRWRVFSFLFRSGSSGGIYVILRLHLSETQLDNWLNCNAMSSSLPIVMLSLFEGTQFCELEQFIFAAYASHLSSTRSDYSISLRVQTHSVYRDPRKFTSLSFSKCIYLQS